MKKYTYKDWFSGKISLLYSPIKIGSEVNRVGWEEIKYTDIPKIKKAQKELFKNKIKELFIKWRNGFFKRAERSQMQQLLISQEIKQCEQIIFSTPQYTDEDGDVYFKHWNVSIEYEYVIAVQKEIRNILIRKSGFGRFDSINYDYINSPNYSHLIPYQVYARAIYEYYKSVKSYFSKKNINIIKKEWFKEKNKIQKTRLVYFNGKFVPESEARISIYDSALMFGDMVFEMTRSFNKKQFKLREHLERLYAGIKILRIPIKMTINQMEKACNDTVAANEHLFSRTDEHRLMINVSRGPLSIYAPIFGNKLEPTVVIADFPLKWTVASMAKLYDTGINAVIPSQRAIPGSLLDPKIKNRSRLHYQMANIEVSGYSGNNNWALLLDTDGFIAEGTGDNFFIVKNGTIFTPEGRNILRGISRHYIFELCQQLKIPFACVNLEPYDVYTADEAFMTGTPFCILPVSSLNSVKIGNLPMGKITSLLLDQWSKNVKVDIVKQIKEYASEVDSATAGSTPYQFLK